MVVSCIVLALTLLLRFGPDVPVLRTLRVAMVETPVRKISEIKRHHLIVLIILAAIIFAGGEIMLFFAPELVAWYATSFAMYPDAMTITALLSAVAMGRRTIRIIRVKLDRRKTLVGPRSRRAAREGKTRAVADRLAARNDDEPPGRFLASAA